MSDIVERLEHCSQNTKDEYIHELTGRSAADIIKLRAELARVTALGEGLADRLKLLASARDKETCAALSAWQGRGDGEG